MSTHEEQALWAIVQEKREDVERLEKDEKAAQREADETRQVADEARKEEREWREAIVAVLGGEAEIEWRESPGCYVVVFKKLGNDGNYPERQVPKPKGQYEGKKRKPPRGAAHVGSTNQGKASTHR